MNNKCSKIIACLVMTIFLYSSLTTATASSSTIETVLTLKQLFSVDSDTISGIKGTITGTGKIEVKVYDSSLNTLLFHTSIIESSDTLSGNVIRYEKQQLGPNALYYPKTWNSTDIKTAVFSTFRKKYDGITSYPVNLFSDENISLTITVEQVNAAIKEIKIPGIGTIDSIGGNILFNANHFCHDLRNRNHPATKAWEKMKSPDITKGSDLLIACHRGIWGNKLGAGNPENSTAAIKETKEYTDVLESDIMITKDGELVVSHDYNLKRISDYSGSDRDYLFNMSASQLANLKLRKRNLEVSEFKFLTFSDLLDEVIKNELVLTIDIKDITARSKNGVCIDNCDFDPKTAGEEAVKRRFESWMDIFQRCVKTAAQKQALQYIAFKVPHTYAQLSNYVSTDTLSQILFMPVIQPSRKDYLEFADEWIRDGGNQVVAYETNFKQKTDKYLEPITRHGETYKNFLHYVYARSGLRPGCYPEEPMGPKGIVNRWAEWLAKDLRKDIRGDYYFLMSIPYGNIMVLTTDRPDMWLWINKMYNEME